MAAIGQTAVLRDLFSLVYAERRPTRLAVLGCTTGQDLQQVDPALTEVIVGVDINPAYLEAARRRSSSLGPRLHLICDDVLTAKLPRGPFDLVHAALLLEYVDAPSLFRRIYDWLSPNGACSVITQEPVPDVAAVSSTRYESLLRLAGRMSLRSAEEVASLAGLVGFRLVRKRAVRLPTGKILVSSLFDKVATFVPSSIPSGR
ncbi:MAG TPA: class I SAM-dependent methyltransferase [Polyangia bacterium]|nr:class I SAM-dependent methyltransferase [Polyangia bacterium]